ncbi:unnamed protein product [Caenorhabditis auriculariae]|uniref:Repressor of RNA polymerase III transcription MAF1 n=1 Tax=Caenorhabditis auriculariae TaxID=2777116 RepID=A0A8S1GTH2_9PELO|nr:unnamed protein product [Caenorhabditis auriculariae]
MKYLENSVLEVLSSALSNSAFDCILDFKLESYSCKMVQSDKKEWKTFDTSVSWSERQPLSPPDEFLSLNASPIGHAARLRHMSERSCSESDNDGEDNSLVDSISRRTLFDLVRVLNSAYPDYDFRNVKSDCFSLVSSFEQVVSLVNGKLATTVFNYCTQRDELWNAVEEGITPNECRIFSFKSPYVDDPFSEDGCIWSLNFFFYNKTLKRLLFLSCRCLSKVSENIFDPAWEDEVEQPE